MHVPCHQYHTCNRPPISLLSHTICLASVPYLSHSCPTAPVIRHLSHDCLMPPVPNPPHATCLTTVQRHLFEKVFPVLLQTCLATGPLPKPREKARCCCTAPYVQQASYAAAWQEQAAKATPTAKRAVDVARTVVVIAVAIASLRQRRHRGASQCPVLSARGSRAACLSGRLRLQDDRWSVSACRPAAAALGLLMKTFSFCTQHLTARCSFTGGKPNKRQSSAQTSVERQLKLCDRVKPVLETADYKLCEKNNQLQDAKATNLQVTGAFVKSQLLKLCEIPGIACC